MKIAFLAALLLGIGSAAGAQEAPPAREASAPLTLRKCLEIGLEQNYDVRIVRNEERVSDNNATAGNAGMLPTVDLSAGYTGTLDNDRTVTPRNGDATTETGVYDQTANVGLAVNWTLFDGLRIRTNYKRLKEMQQMGALKTRITIEDFMASLTAEYYNYIQQTLRLENFRYAVSLSRERLRITEARVQVGNFSRLDLLQARVDFNADSSKYMSQHELVTASRIRINELLANENLDERFSIPDSVIRVNATLDWNDLLAKTLSANASLLMAEHDSSLAELDLKTVLARNYPYVNLTTGYGYTYNRYGTGGNLSRGTLGLNAGVKVGFTIFDGNRRREQRNARIGVENAQLTVEFLAGLPQQPRSDPARGGEPDRRQGELRNRHGTLPAGRPAGHRDARGAEEPAGRRGAHPHGAVQHQTVRNLVAADQRQRDGLSGIIRESSHSFAIKTFRTLRLLFFAAFWSAVNRGLRPRKLMYFLTAKSTKNSPTDAFAYFVPSNVRPPKRRVLGDCANIHKTGALSLGAEQEQPTACVPGAGGWQRRPQAKADTCCLPSRHSLYGACFCAVKA